MKTAISILLGLTVGLAMAQYRLPTPEVLRANNIQQMDIWVQALRYEGGPEKKRLALGKPDTTSLLETTYYLNSRGYPDSVKTFFSPNGKFNRLTTHTYSKTGVLIAKREFDETRTCLGESTIEIDSNGTITTKHFQGGKIQLLSVWNQDNILCLSRYYRHSMDTGWVQQITYNPETNLRIEHWRGLNGQYAIETFQWFTTEGKPTSFRHTLEERKGESKKIIQKEKTYALDSEGQVVNKYTGRFDDPYLNYNYFEREKQFQPLMFQGQDLFSLQDLVEKQEVSQLWTFSGIERILRYSIVYTPF